MTTLNWSWRDAAARSTEALPTDVTCLQIGDEAESLALMDAIVVLDRPVIAFASDVESRLLAGLSFGATLLGCPAAGVRSLTLPRSEPQASLQDVLQHHAMTTELVLQSGPEGSPERSPLVPRDSATWTRWRAELLAALSPQLSGGSHVRAMELAGGARLLQDDLDGSHQCSQAIEGEGDHSGDYWHAIMHRREPDYQNSKYWFRHVGRHAIFPPLVEEWQRFSPGPSAWPGIDRAVASGSWEPAAFVDACAASARDDSPGSEILRELQYRELLILWRHVCTRT